jgi:hypothetical protein
VQLPSPRLLVSSCVPTSILQTISLHVETGLRLLGQSLRHPPGIGPKHSPAAPRLEHLLLLLLHVH